MQCPSKSIIAPFLFLVCIFSINDLPTCTDSKTLLNADGKIARGKIASTAEEAVFISSTNTFDGKIFVELMEMATSSVEFSFNDIMHRQIERVVMGSPLANIFVG